MAVSLNIGAGGQGIGFRKNLDQHRTMTPLGPGWEDLCLLSCIVGCVRLYKSCHSVRYDEHSRLCTPGSWLYESRDSNLSGEGAIYYSVSSNVPCMDFQIYSRGNVHTWVWVSTAALNYTEAKKNCTARGSHLYTIKDTDKLDILLNITKNSSAFWIGLDDLEVENTFKWGDDDSEMINDLRGKLFHADQPDDKHSSEDCVEFNAGYGPLNDKNCSAQTKFICEINCVLSLS